MQNLNATYIPGKNKKICPTSSNEYWIPRIPEKETKH